MTLGRQPHSSDANVTRRAFFGSIRGLAAAVVFLLTLTATMLSAGCGGSSSRDDDGGGGNENAVATITGRLVDRNGGNAGVAGATVTYAGSSSNPASVTTGVDGTFTLSVVAGIGEQRLVVTPPAGTGFYSTALIQGVGSDILSTGAVIPSLTEGQTYSLGEVVLYSQNGPPPPPLFP